MPNTLLDRVLADLAEYPDSSARQIADRVGSDDRTVFALLECAAADGLCCRRKPQGARPWLWKTRLRWSDVARLAAQIAEAVAADGIPDAVVAVARGGLVPAQLVAENLDVREVASVGARFTDPERTEMLVYSTPVWHYGQPKRVALIEDAVGTGRIIEAAAEELAVPEVRTAALVAAGEWRPDYVGVVAPSIPVMPWERAAGGVTL